MTRKSLISTFLVTIIATFSLLSACQSTQETSEQTEVEVDDVAEEITEETGVMEETEVMEGELVGDMETTILLNGFNYGFSLEEIRVQEGQTVTIEFTSTDGFHNWVVDEFDAATEQVQTGETSSVTFVADKKGTFEFYCSVGKHRALGMVGTLIVE